MLDLSKFPELFHDCLNQALTNWGAQALTGRKELGGKSGAYVWLVDIETSKYNGPGILKFATKELIETELSNHQLGSGLIDHSQKMTVAAMQMAEKNVWAHRS
jgi:hypothetical protein